MNPQLVALAHEVGIALQSRGWRMAAAESCTGGLVAAAITEIAGSSNWFERGFVTYSNDAKIELLGVSPATLQRHGAVSEEMVREMVGGALDHSHADVALAISGIAGPGGGTPDKPVGMVCFAWQQVRGEPRSVTRHFEGGRAEVRLHAALFALNELRALVS